VAKKLVEELGKRYATRAGGYTRIMRMHGYRIGDGGSKAVFELVDNQVLAAQLAKKAEVEAQPTK
jgi:large subunit ribosomal protein L17